MPKFRNQLLFSRFSYLTGLMPIFRPVATQIPCSSVSSD